MESIEGDKKQEGTKSVSSEDVTKPLRNQRALIRVIEKTMKEIEATFEEPQQEVVNMLLSQQSLTSESSSGLKSLHDVTKECILGLHAQGIPVEQWDAILVHLTLRKLDKVSHAAFEQSLKDNRSLVSLQELLQFIENRFQSLDTFGRGFDQKRWNTSRLVAVTNEQFSTEKLCLACKRDSHPLYTCKSFLQDAPSKRLHLDQQMRLCINCLKTGHFAKECKSSSCKKCDKKHNSLLHLEDPSRKATRPEVNNSISLVSNSNNHTRCYVMLGTARITIKGNRGTEIECRTLLDSGSQVNLITDRLMKKLGENPQRAAACIEARVEAYVIPKIVSDQPSVHIDISNWKIPSNNKLADPGFNASDKIDIDKIEFLHQLLSIGQIRIGNNLPSLQNTLLGWIVIGRISDHELPTQTQTCGVLSDDDEILEQVIEKFWKLDAMEPTTKTLSPHEELCESHFVNNTQQTNLGRFVVKLPFKQNPESLGEFDQIAINRFYALERRFVTNETVWQQYVNFMREYENMGHMEKSDIEGSASHYIIPHHCVLRPESSTTKLRVVFDASCKTHNDVQGSYSAQTLKRCTGKSLYIRMMGITKLLFGENRHVVMAPYLAVKCLQQLIIKESSKYPLGASAIQNDFYIDDCLSGSDNLNTALEIQRQLKDLLESAGFTLRKWCAKDPSLLKNTAKQDQEVDLDFDSEDQPFIKTLGLVWQPKIDKFSIKVDLHSAKRVTKR
ncbi:uncharacterized protein LOC119665940 [Teleopsis dalmanni]|uniref:uncharacterized protein LOC119665940 n=1 Tax=Teleopsis dalmanni TaxID=139649 RepID=UPI0018CE9AB8|nr:uncharacterized protein LOC119665940 [Teleopsis dalmanni]